MGETDPVEGETLPDSWDCLSHVSLHQSDCGQVRKKLSGHAAEVEGSGGRQLFMLVLVSMEVLQMSVIFLKVLSISPQGLRGAW